MLRCESRDSLKCKLTSRRTDRITNGKNTRVKDSDNISGICLIYHMAGFCHPVSMCLVHVCLDLEYECGEIIRHRIDLTLIGYSRKWRGCHLEEVLKESLHTEVCKRGTEEYRCHISLAYLFLVKFHTCSVQKLDLIHELFLLIRIYDVVKSCIVNIDFFDHTFLGSLLCVREGQDFVCISVINSTEFLTGTDRPVDRAGCDPVR